MPKKTNKPNGFIMYAEEIKNQLLMEGHTIRSKADLITAASPKWQQLPDDEKEYYKEKSKWEWENRHKSGRYQNNPLVSHRKDNLGNPLAQRVDIIKINEEKRKREREDVFMSFQPGKGALQKKFYFIGFISLLDEPTEQGWPMLEIAAVEYSIQNGIERFWHSFINPVEVPQGYRYKAQFKSDSTHLIDPEGRALPHQKYTQIYDQLFEFLSGGSQIIPPIYSKISEIERVEGCLKYLAENAGRPNQLKRIYELEGLILDLDAHLRGNPQNFIASKQAATELISSTMFDFDNGTRCDWHEENESKHCALGIVNRYCYCVGDYFCTEFDIPISERHLPLRNNEPCYTLIPSANDRQQQKARKVQEASKRNDDIAQLVAEKLQLAYEHESNVEAAYNEQQVQQDEERRKWMQYRGGSTNNNQTAAQLIEKTNISKVALAGSSSDLNEDVAKAPIVGRGRGRGQALIANLRKPGERPTTDTVVKPPPGFTSDCHLFPIELDSNAKHTTGRGLRIYEQSNNPEKRWAGATSAPAASTAPSPPSNWMAKPTSTSS